MQDVNLEFILGAVIILVWLIGIYKLSKNDVE